MTNLAEAMSDSRRVPPGDKSAPISAGVLGVDIDAQTGPTDREKIIAAAKAAIALGLPVLLKRTYRTQRIRFNQAYDGLKFIGLGETTGFKMVDAPDSSDTAWGWMLHFDPDAGTSMTVSLSNCVIDGNRQAAGVISQLTARPTSTWGIVADGGGYRGRPNAGSVVVNLNAVYSDSWDMSGVQILGDKAEVRSIECKARFCGEAGYDCTRGRLIASKLECAYNGGYQINLSALEFAHLKDCYAHHGGRAHPKAAKPINNIAIGGGMKISLRADGSNPATHFVLDNVLIEDNAGVGLGSTSAGPRALIQGANVTLRRNGGGSINLSDGSNIDVGYLCCEDGLKRYQASELIAGLRQAALDPNSTDVLLSGGGVANFGTIVVKRSLGYGINGGYGSKLSAQVMWLEDNAAGYKHLRFVENPGQNTSVKIGDLTLKGTGGTVPELISGAVIGATHLR